MHIINLRRVISSTISMELYSKNPHFIDAYNLLIAAQVNENMRK